MGGLVNRPLYVDGMLDQEATRRRDALADEVHAAAIAPLRWFGTALISAVPVVPPTLTICGRHPVEPRQRHGRAPRQRHVRFWRILRECFQPTSRLGRS
jgi:hypothetical protein